MLSLQKESGTGQSIAIAATKPEEIDVIALDKLLSHAYKCLSVRRETRHLVTAAQMYNAVRMLQN